jgi:hypothetical protein
VRLLRGVSRGVGRDASDTGSAGRTGSRNNLSFLDKTIDMLPDPAIINCGGPERNVKVCFALTLVFIFYMLPFGVKPASSLFRPRRYA